MNLILSQRDGDTVKHHSFSVWPDDLTEHESPEYSHPFALLLHLLEMQLRI